MNNVLIVDKKERDKKYREWMELIRQLDLEWRKKNPSKLVK